VRNLFLMCGCRFRFLDRTLFGDGPFLYLEDLNPLTISRIDSRLGLRSPSDERQDETTKCGNDTIPHGTNTPLAASLLLNTPEANGTDESDDIVTDSRFCKLLVGNHVIRVRLNGSVVTRFVWSPQPS
jgi:hypothetical protein